MRLSHLNVRIKSVIAGFLAVLIVGLMWYATSGYVAAYREIRTVHVFPTFAIATGWQNPTAALVQELSADAPYESFTRNNSAYISIAANTPVVETSRAGDTTGASTTPVTTDEALPTDDTASTTPQETDVAPGPVETPSETPTETQTESTPVTPADVPAETPAETPIENPVETPIETPVETPAPVESAPPSVEARVSDVFFKFVHSLVPTVYATTTEEIVAVDSTTDTPAVSDDVPTCFLQQKECHTITLAGFNVAGEITQTTFRSAVLNFSFAANIGETELIDDKLEVRYFHAGKWREVGEIYLNKQLSNASNGQYFSATLDEVESWEELSDVKVVIEYDRNNNSAVDLYLDSVWIDTQYRELLADEIAGNNEAPVLPDNVELQLNETGTAGELVLSDGSKITFPFTDDLEDTLVIRTDKSVYAHAGEIVYASLTNTGRVPDSVRLYGASPRGFGTVLKMEELKRNVPTTSETPRFEDVTYFCESGWSDASASASSSDALSGHTCDATGETRICSSLNKDRTNCSVAQVEVGSDTTSTYTNGWVQLPISSAQESHDSIAEFFPPHYRAIAQTDETIEILPGQTVYVRLAIESTKKDELRFALYAQGSVISGDLVSDLLKEEAVLRGEDTKQVARKKGNARLFGKAEFDGDELPEFKFQFKSKRNFVSRGINALLGRGNEFAVQDATFVRDDGSVEVVPLSIEYGENGEWTLEMKTHPRSFRPGKYTAKIVLREGADEFTEEVEFYWGILAMNTTQTIYKPGDVVPIAMAALDEAGDTVCDAFLELSVFAPDGTVTDVPVETSGLCGDNNVIDVADYLAVYTAGGTGEYTLALTERDGEGLIVHRIFDSFEVRESSPFIIRRTGMTRIYPVANYTMNLDITSETDFEGEFIEPIPADFQIVQTDASETRMYGGAKNLVWPLTLRAGETRRISYTYDAPDISPYMYLLGPAEIRGSEDSIPFRETRQWKLASDATGNMLLYWDQTWIPTGWTCVSCLPADSFYQRFVMGSSTAGTNGGSATVTHTATGAVAASGGTQGVDTNNQATPLSTHTHTYTPTIGSTSTLPVYRQLAIIQYNSTGDPTTLPAGAIAMFDATVPAGWTAYTTQNGNYIRGESTSTVGTVGGSNTHLHSVTGTTGNAVNNVNVRNPGTSVTVAVASHTHTISTSTGLVSNEPPYIEAILGKLTATSSISMDMIAMWSGDPPVGWQTVSSSTEAFANKFVKASTTYGGTGGAFTHTHTDITGYISTGPSGAGVARDSTPANATVASQAHTHSVNITAFTTDSHLPPYRTAVFAKRTGVPPAAPTLHDTLFDNEKTGTSTPRFEFTANDSSGSDDILYQIQWDDDSDLDTSPLGDRTSDVETGCSPNCFINTISGGDSSPFTESERIRFTIQTPLVSGTTYYWRVRAKTSLGSTWGSWATTTNFTYIAGTDPSQWFQTEDGQFDTNTLSGVETFGSDSVRLTIASPEEALIAYGESTVQTPRYRLWDGGVWGSENSAQSVGGTINWIVTKAAPTRDEYILGTLDASNDVNVQVYDGVADTWGDLQEVIGGAGGVSNNARRGFDIAYETSSGDAIVVYCDGDADPAYYVWNGSSWTSGGTINLASANNCEYIKLASDPVSDEIILVARDTGASYEAQVWDGSAWGNSQVMGSMTDVAHEGIGLEYEESGNQAMMVVSNGGTSGFRWSTWDGSGWSINTTQGLGDDFEWGRLRADVGTDALTLCYIDQDADVGTLTWDGNAWDTYSAAGDERETAGNSNTGRAVDCAYETTAGRDGNIMLTLSSTTASQYQVWNGSAWSYRLPISTIEDSITVSTIRTGGGKILSAFHDDVNARFDVSDWNGSSWTARTAIESSPSVTVAPFMQAYDMAAQVYQSNTGTMTTQTIDFDQVPSRPTWGEILWRTTEPSGTDVTLQVYYESAGVCNVIVPNGTLPGNAAGFDVTASPLDISALSTSTYNRICIKTTFTTSNQNPPTLDEWTLTWERQPYLTQTHFRWYANSASSLTPSDAWPTGGNDVAEDTSIPTAYAPSPGDVLRLRLGVLVENVTLASGQLILKLQYAAGSSCSAGLSWQDVGAIGSTTALWRGHNNAALSDGASIVSRLLSTTDANGSYEEENDSATNPNSVSVNDEGEWDWVIQHNASSSASYCFRVVTDNGEIINEYDAYPALITNSPPGVPALEAPFDHEALASTTPWFEFVAEDPESDDMTYQIQIDDDAAFGSVNIDRDSQNFIDEFTNLVTPSDKDPFTTAQSVRFIPTTALSNGTTYYWRVRAKDRNESAEWSSWSSVNSVTIDTGVTISTWRQTTLYQFSTDTLEDTETSAPGDVILSGGFTYGSTTGTTVDFDSKTSGNAWGALSWNDNETAGDIKYHLEYFDGADWVFIPDTDLPGNGAGFDTSPVSLLGVSPTIYNEIRILADFTDSGGSPRLLDWTIAWGLAVEQPQPTALFDNEKTATTTPTFVFSSGDPQGDDLVYEISFSTTNDFTSSTTRRSNIHSGFVNSASSTDTSPFTQDDSIRFTLQPADALTNGTTYWWRVRAIDPSGGNVWSVWSDLRSFTIDTSVIVSTWFQTTDEQWATDGLSSIETNSGSARITTTIREAFAVYSQGTVQVPRFRIWNGTSWGTEQSGVSVGDTIRFSEAVASPTRDEYIIATQGATGQIDVQVVDGTTDTAGNKVEVSNAADLTQRGFDVAYETTSGDALAVACYGTEATYRKWNGASWSATSSITLAVSANCEWVKLAADPTSNEIIAVFRDATTGAVDYQALVWDGSAFGNSMTMGSQVTVANEGIAVEYEESGGQAIVVTSNGANNNFIWNSWNGSSWLGTATVVTGNDFANGRLVRDVGSDNLALCYVDLNTDIGYARWTGAAWAGAGAVIDATGNSNNSRPVSCEFETSAGRDGYIMIPYSDTVAAEYVFYNGSVLSSPALTVTTISDAAEVRTARTGDGNILMLAYDDANTEYDFTYWNGTAWSVEQVLEDTSITTVVPPTIPIDIVARRYPAFVAGTVESSAIVFSSGSGPKWGAIAFSKTTPGSSSVTVQLEYFTSTSSWALIPDSGLAGNSVGTTTSPIDISNVNRITYSTIRMKASLACVAGNCPTLNDWTLSWAEGINVSGTVKAYDQSTNVTSGTVAVAVNGVIQSGKTAVISGGTFTIANVTVFQDDSVTVFVDGAAEANEAVAITTYDGNGDITGLNLYEHHLSLGSDDNQTVTNTNISQYDNSVSGDEDIFYDVVGNNLSSCVSGSGSCTDIEIWIKSGTTFRPDSASLGNVTTYGLENNGTLTADGNTISLTGSWDNNATFNRDGSTVIFIATTSTQSIDSTGAALGTFNNVTFGQTSGSATWTLSSLLDIDGTLTVNFGTLSPGAQQITLAGNLTFGASGVFAKGSATTTFDGSSTATWTDNTVAKQDMGTTTIDGTAKLVNLGSGAKVTNVTIGADDTLSVNNNYPLEVTGNWTNNNAFVAQSGTVTFSATTTGKTIAPGSSSFYNITFNGTGGNWAFSAPVTAGNDLTITNGTVSLPTSTTTITGSLSVTGGTFQHNNGAVLFNATAAGKTITASSSSFYDLAFSGTGSWSFSGANATSSRNVTITQGTVTLPSGTFAVGGFFANNGGTFTHNSGTLKLTANNAQTLRLGGSSAHNLTFSGAAGSWSFSDTNATSTGTFRIENGTTTLPAGVLAVGGSWAIAGGAFTHNGGTVRFNSTGSGNTIQANNSLFYNMLFDSVTGGWTLSQSATSTNNVSLTNAANLTLSSGLALGVGGTFSNALSPATTTWTGTTITLYSGGTYAINAKTSAGDTYGTLVLSTSTKISMWNSSAATSSVGSGSSLYSQDHAGVDGSLYIYGDYTRSSGTEYWTYANDFDGTALGGSSRAVNVRIASSSSLTFSAGLLQLLGSATASSTIANQGSGTFAFAVTGGTINAQYFSVRNTDQNGLNVSGTTAITSLADGDYELGVNGATMITVASTVIDANAALQIQRNRFATSSGITTGSNVTETGTPSSYWWFRNHYGNVAGESYDVDPGGNPGFIRWDDSSLSITVAGHVYSDHGSTVIGNPPCDGSTQSVKIVVNGATTYTGSCNAGSGAFSISGIGIAGDVVLTGYLDTNGGKRAVTITRTPTTDISDFDLYENVVIVRHEDTSPITIAQIATFTGSQDSDIPLTASTSSPPSTLVLNPDTELYVWAGKTFTPGGNVTLTSGGSGNIRDGRLMLATSSAFIAAGTESHAIGGGLSVASGATFTTASSTFTFTATTTNKSINSSVPLSFYDLSFNGSGGGWVLGSVATTSVTNGFAMTAGTLSGTGDMHVSTGSITGAGTIAMSGGTFLVSGTGSIGSASSWTFNNLTLGAGGVNTTSKTGVGTTTIAGVLTVSTGQTLNASSTNWVLTGGGIPFVVSGTFNVQTAPFFFTSNASTTIADTSYAALYFAPANAGTPVYALKGGTLSAAALTLGGANPVFIDADALDPSLNIAGSVSIGSGSTYKASNVGAFDVGGSWQNNGTFVHSNGSVNFNSTDTGETVNPGTSSFYDLSFANAGGGWTVSQNATTTRNFTLTSASNFTLANARTLAVGGTFTNSVGGAATTWATTTLSLTSGTSFAMNTKSASGDEYGTLAISAGTKASMWNSSAATTTAASGSSLYSQDHAGVDGSLYIWGDYTRSAGTDYWDYATDFDGTSIASSSRQVNVRIATSSTLTFSGGGLSVVGASNATTTIANQGTGRYALSLSAGSTTMQYFQLRDTDVNGLNISGATIVNSLSDGDFQLGVNGGTSLTVAGSVMNANPLKIFLRNSFATSSGITSGFNVMATGVSVSSWKFNLHYGNYDGEAFDSDPDGDPGYVRWDDSASNITISGNVYSDEGTTVSTVCDSSTAVVRLKIQGAGTFTSACDSSTGLYSIPGVAFNPGDAITVFLDTAGGRRAANVSVDPVSSISNMHLYENRVIVRHEDVNPMTIATMTQYDSDQDTDIPFNATIGGTNTLVLQPNTKLIVWNSKTFTPGGNVTLTSGGLSNSWDGTLEVSTSSVITFGTNQSHSIGGSLIVGSGASLTSASSTITMTATTSGKTITLNGSSVHSIVFSGSGGNWAFSDSTMTAQNDFTITSGTVTMPSATTTIGGSFQNTGGTFQHNNGTVLMNATASGKLVRVNGSALYSIDFNGSGGSWSFVDTSATSSNNFTVTAGTVTVPSTMLTVGGSFQNFGTISMGLGTLKLIANTTGNSIRTGGSALYNVLVDGVGGGWTFTDTNVTATRDFTILHGTTTLPTGTFSVGGSWLTSGGGFTAGTGTVTLNATTTGKTIDPGISNFGNLVFNSSAGGWTISQNATSSANTSITSANSFTLTSGKTLAVGGTFTNSVGGAATTWATTTLSLFSGTNYSINTKSAGNDVYGTLVVGTSTDVRMWNSTAATTTVDATGSLYSQDNANLAGTGIDGDLYIWGEYVLGSGNDYWSYATDFDGAALGGSSRQVNVKIATSSSITLSGGTLEILGSTATTTIANQGTGRYAFSVTGGTLNASHYQIRNTDPNGLSFSGSPTITALDYGDLQLSVNGGSMITVTDTAIDANASKQINYVSFATSSGITTGFNVSRIGTSTAAWTFLNHNGNYAGEAYDFDGADSCGKLRWSDSSCLFVNQGHYRWRADDGGIGAPNTEWYSASWSKRKRIAVSNSTAGTLTNQAVKIVVTYDSDMQSDFEDLRFTDSSGTTTIPYWIESSVASASSTVWVKLSSIPANGSAVVYMYYGNSGVTDGGDGASTFKAFDDFEDDNVTEYSNTTLFDTDTSFNHNYLYGLDAGSNTELRTTTGGMYRTGSLTAPGDTIRFYQYMDASAEDEPCTLFAVQSSSQNYAVCLDQYPAERVALREDVLSNDGSATGSLIASTTVTFATGWYEVQVDWLTNNDINVTVYDSTGAVFATVSGNDSTRSAGGGIGFSFWYQHGGWDFYSVRPYVSAAPTYVFGAEQVSDGASWMAAEDTSLSGALTGQNLRVRFTVQNTGSTLASKQFKLQYASKGAALNCESATGFADVPTTSGAGCGGQAACMTTSSQFTDQTAISDLLSRPANMSFAQGKIMEDPSAQTNAMDVGTNEATEVEYNFQLTTNAVANSYCFRTARVDTGPLDSYDRVAEVVIAHAPTITNFSFPLNTILAGGIVTVEGTTTTVTATGTVTDLNGYADILSATSSIYRSLVAGGELCTSNENNCYRVPTCSLTNCAGSACTLTCSADVQYFAEPTDSGTYSAEDWLVNVRVQDSTGLSTTATTSSEMLTTRGLTVDTSITYDDNDAFPGMEPGADTGSRVATTTVTNTGNSPIDIRLSGDSVGSIPVNSQKYSTSTFTYAACSVCALLAGPSTPANAGLNIPKATASTSPTTDKVYWGISIPIPTATGVQSGTNYFEAASP